MSIDIDRTILQTIIDLDDAARAADSRRACASDGPATGQPSDDLLRPPTPEEQLLRQRLGELDDPTMARVLATYWGGRRITFGEAVDEGAYRDLLAHAEANLDDAAAYLMGKTNLGASLRAAMADLGD